MMACPNHRHWLDQRQRSKLSTGSSVNSFPRTFPSSTDVPVLLLNQPNIKTDRTFRLHTYDDVHEVINLNSVKYETLI